MHRSCRRVLPAVEESCDPFLRQFYTLVYLKNESQLLWTVGWVLITPSVSKGGVWDRRPLKLAAEAMNVFFSTGTSDFICKQVLGKEIGMPIEFVSE
jgi:hypothetical protein